MVAVMGLEPITHYWDLILSQTRIPIPPHSHDK